ncbi:aryl-sulfate sulfotransferase [Halorussus sp. AFM4]|uniref:aryl-sulfate sulfotransferase n=1 Tax=Halorussus sp. AFM4 TaxID=3421651 RepID=UPI003EBA5E5C
MLVVLFVVLSVQALLADTSRSFSQSQSEVQPGATLISIQDYNYDGKLIEVGRNGSVNWEFDPPRSQVFDSEYLANGNVLVAVATKTPPENCPEAQLDQAESKCVHNRVLELDGEALQQNNETRVVWRYTWYDEFLQHHEVHDVDRLSTGETAIVDMGNNRAFTVARNGTITWQWNGSKYLGTGSAFDQQYGSPERQGPESDWTHMNDIDQLPNGNFQLSVRNFDVIVEVNPQTNEIADVIGEPGNHSFLYEQHNPHRLTEWGTILIADSENNRIVEYDLQSESPVWTYGGDDILLWPRDADRLPNGNTLIVDSLNNRVIEVNRDGEIVWEYAGVQLPYTADRKGVSEEQGKTIPGWRLEGRVENAHPAVGFVRKIEGWASYVFPEWVRLPELLTLLAIVLITVALLADLIRQYGPTHLPRIGR